jgi:hypothetical protein
MIERRIARAVQAQQCPDRIVVPIDNRLFDLGRSGRTAREEAAHPFFDTLLVFFSTIKVY